MGQLLTTAVCASSQLCGSAYTPRDRFVYPATTGTIPFAARLDSRVFWSTGRFGDLVKRFEPFHYEPSVCSLDAAGLCLDIHEVAYWLPNATVTPAVPVCDYRKCVVTDEVRVDTTNATTGQSLGAVLLALHTGLALSPKHDTHRLRIHAEEIPIRGLWYKPIHARVVYSARGLATRLHATVPLVAKGRVQILYGAVEK